MNRYGVVDLSGIGFIKRIPIQGVLKESVHEGDTIEIVNMESALLFEPVGSTVINAPKMLESLKLSDDEQRTLNNFIEELKDIRHPQELIIDPSIQVTSNLPVLTIQKVEIVDEKGEDEISADSVNDHKNTMDEKPSMSSKSSHKESLLDSKVSVSDHGILPGWTSYILPFILFAIGLATLLWIARLWTSEVATTDNANDLRVEIDHVAENRTSLIEHDHNAILDSIDSSKYHNILTADIVKNGCIIAIGTFNNVSNASSLQQTAISLGYDCSIMHYEGGSRVVITFDCLEHDLEEYLAEVKTNIAPQAWFFQPSYDPF